jgi:hypothetical protein
MGVKGWPLVFKEEHRLRIFENRVRRMIFGPKCEDVKGGWRRLHNDLYPSPNRVRVIKLRWMVWARHVERNVITGLVGKPRGTDSLGRPRRRWKYNFKMSLKEIIFNVKCTWHCSTHFYFQPGMLITKTRAASFTTFCFTLQTMATYHQHH